MHVTSFLEKELKEIQNNFVFLQNFENFISKSI